MWKPEDTIIPLFLSGPPLGVGEHNKVSHWCRTFPGIKAGWSGSSRNLPTNVSLVLRVKMGAVTPCPAHTPSHGF